MSQKSCGMIQGLLRFKDRPRSIGTPLSCFMPVTASGLTMPCLPANLVGPAQAAVEIAEQTFFDAGSRDCRRYAPAHEPEFTRPSRIGGKRTFAKLRPSSIVPRADGSRAWQTTRCCSRTAQQPMPNALHPPCDPVLQRHERKSRKAATAP